jgi:hypothetical protein
MITILQEPNGSKVLAIQVSGKLSKDDYASFVPQVERMIAEKGKLRVLFDMMDFHGWDAGALWEDIKFDLKHFSDIQRVAMVGDKQWEKGMSAVCRVFTTAKIRYFDRQQANEARAWVEASN